VNAVGVIEQFVQNAVRSSGGNWHSQASKNSRDKTPGLSSRAHQAVGGPQRGRDGHCPCNRLRDGSRLRDWPHLDDGGSLPVDRLPAESSADCRRASLGVWLR
jgi:hypothetical protein